MTRINVVPPRELHDKHLMAEYRELPRVFGLARVCPEAPEQYTLGKGHVVFFYDKLQYLVERFNSILAEIDRRGFNANYRELRTQHCPPELFGNYEPTPESLVINRARIAERLNQMENPPRAGVISTTNDGHHVV